jgi:hypothetical protein
LDNIYSVSEVLDLTKEVAKADEVNDTEVGDFIEKAKGEDLVLARIPMTSAQSATKKIVEHTNDFIRKDVEEKGTFKISDTVFHSVSPYKYKVMELPNFVRWLVGDIGDDKIADLCAVLGASFVPKLRGLDAIAERRGSTPQAIRDTFLHREIEDKKKLLIINCSSASAPKWAQNMEDGERYEPA